jgi:hypothetical protein
MSWIESHSISENFASEAEAAIAEGNWEKAIGLYLEAARFETQAITELEKGKPRTLGITYVSSASLWFKGNDLAKSELIAFKGLGSDEIQEPAKNKLREIIQTIWNERALNNSGIEFTKDSVLISIKGKKIVTGGAPLDLILSKVDQVGKIFYRITEMKLNKPFRRKGLPSQDIQEQYKPWLFQAPAGSYQFAVRVEKPKQPSLYPGFESDVDDIADTFMQVIKTSVEDPDGELKEIAPDEEYRDVLLRLTRNLIPTGKIFDTLEIRAPESPIYRPIVLKTVSRDYINASLNAASKKDEATPEETIKISGILKGLSLNLDSLEIDTIEDNNPKTVHVYQTGAAIDDVIGPMVNHQIVCEVTRAKNGKFHYRDIQFDE